nr:protein CHAPERONE-LIKE PROTEIN OF POR1, chloroplastic-like [Malus domestica]
MTSVSGLTGSPSRFCFQIPARSSGSLRGRVSNFPHGWKPAGKNELLRVERSYWTGFAQRLNARKTHLIKFAVDASYGDMSNEPTAIFPRINVRDPYKRLGISREASEDEIQGARNFLIRQYAGHKPSVDAIESAHDKIIMQKFYDRKNPKIDFKKKYREVNQSRVVQAVRNRFRTPSTIFIVKTSIAFLVLAALTVLFPTEEGPTLQVALSLLATIYFVHDRLKSKLRAFLYSAGSFAFSWLFGTFLMVCGSTSTERTKEFRGDNVIDNLCATLGLVNLSQVVSVLTTHLNFVGVGNRRFSRRFSSCADFSAIVTVLMTMLIILAKCRRDLFSVIWRTMCVFSFYLGGIPI